MTWREAYQEFGHGYWTQLMTRLEANVSAMGRAAGVSRSDVYKRLRRFGVVLPAVRPTNQFAHRGNWGDL